MQFFVYLQAVFGNFRLFSKTRLHAYLSSFSKHFFGLESWQGSQLTTNTKKVTHPCFAGKIFGRKIHFSKIWTNTIFQILRQNFCQKHIKSVPLERQKILKKSIFLIKALSTFCGISVNISNCHDSFLFICTRKLVVFCKMLMSTCSASFRFFRYMELVVLAFEDEKW